MPDNPSVADWQAVVARFSLGQPLGAPAYVARGAMGEVWRLETTAGRWAVKWQFPWAPAEPVPADMAIQRAAADAGIPLPLPVTTADAHTADAATSAAAPAEVPTSTGP